MKPLVKIIPLLQNQTNQLELLFSMSKLNHELSK